MQPQTKSRHRSCMAELGTFRSVNWTHWLRDSFFGLACSLVVLILTLHSKCHHLHILCELYIHTFQFLVSMYTHVKSRRIIEMHLFTIYMWKRSIFPTPRGRCSLNIVQTLHRSRNWVSVLSLDYWPAVGNIRKDFVPYFFMCSISFFTSVYYFQLIIIPVCKWAFLLLDRSS